MDSDCWAKLYYALESTFYLLVEYREKRSRESLENIEKIIREFFGERIAGEVTAIINREVRSVDFSPSDTTILVKNKLMSMLNNCVD